MNRLPQGALGTRWGKVGPHFLTNSERQVRSKNTKIPVHEGCCVYDVSLRYRVCRFRELAQIGAAPTVHLEEQEIRPDCEPTIPRTLNSPGLKTDWYSDWHRAGLWTPAWPDFSCPRLVCISSKTERKGGGGQQGGATAWLLMKIHQNIIFWGHVRSSKNSEDIFAGIDILKKFKYLISFPTIWGKSWRGQLWPHPV